MAIRTAPRILQPTPVADDKADPRKEYVAGGGVTYLRHAPRALNWAIDDITADFGDDLYERMMRDSQVTACVNIFRAAILEDGVNVACALDDADADGYELAAELADLTERSLDDMDTSLDEVLWDMLAALAFGNRVAEEVYDLDTTYTGRRQLTLRSLKVKPRRATAFVVDHFMNVLGMVALLPDYPMSLPAGTLLTGLDAANILPRSKFAVYSFRPENSDPRGKSLLRSSYTPWWEKMQVGGEYLKYLARFASPSVIGFTAPNVKTTSSAATPEQVMLDALLEFHNGTAAAFANGASVQFIQATGEGQPFIHALAEKDRQITKAILHQTLATEEGQHQARAASEVHENILGTMVRQAKKAVERMLRRDVLRQMVRMNYGDKAVALTPHVTLGETEQQDMSGLMNAIAALERVGYLAPSQKPAVDIMLGLPQRTAEETQVAVDALFAPPPPPLLPTDAVEPDEENADEDEVDEDGGEEGNDLSVSTSAEGGK